MPHFAGLEVQQCMLLDAMMLKIFSKVNDSVILYRNIVSEQKSVLGKASLRQSQHLLGVLTFTV